MVDFVNDVVESHVVARFFSKPQLQAYMLENYLCKRYRDALHVETAKGEFWLFDYGVIVCWGVEEEQKLLMLNQLQSFMIDPFKQPEFERYSFEIGAESNRMHADHIYLHVDDHWSRLAVSHALAQSVKLGQFESRAQQVIEANEYIPRSLANTGKIPLSRKQLAKLRGVLFSVKSDILLNFNLLDTPEFFWDYSELEPIYALVSRYLDIVSRVNVLNKRLEAIHELLEMLASEQNHTHSSLLEWIIIVLIAVEIGLFFWH